LVKKNQAQFEFDFLDFSNWKRDFIDSLFILKWIHRNITINLFATQIFFQTRINYFP
jgi:hypothetical protein